MFWFKLSLKIIQPGMIYLPAVCPALHKADIQRIRSDPVKGMRFAQFIRRLIDDSFPAAVQIAEIEQAAGGIGVRRSALLDYVCSLSNFAKKHFIAEDNFLLARKVNPILLCMNIAKLTTTHNGLMRLSTAKLSFPTS